MKKSHYVPILVSVLLSACNSGNNTQNTSSVNNSQLAEYKAQLKYTTSISNDTVLGNPAATRQQSFVSPTGGVTLNSVRVTLFNSTNCSYGTESQVVTMNGGAGVLFPAGTYTSTTASNLSLASRFSGESIAAFAASSVRFDYGYNAVGDQESGWVSAECIESGIGNFDPHPPEVCTNDQPCGFNSLQIASLPESFVPAIFVTESQFTGNLQAEASARNPSGTFNGFTGADYLCQTDSNLPSRGAGSLWRALVYNNASTAININYYRSDYSTLIAKAMGENLTFINSDDDYSLINSIVTVPVSTPAPIVWTGLSTNTTLLTCQDWTSADSSIEGLIGVSTAANTDWGVVATAPCNLVQHLYCVQQAN
jgi:hypothetical protein